MDFDDLAGTNVVLNMFSVPMTNLPTSTNNYLVFRIVETDFVSECFGKSFTDLKPKSSPKILLDSLAHILNKYMLGTQHFTDDIFDIHYWAPRSPRWSQIVEEVKDEAGTKTLEMRVWCFIHDPKLNIARGFERLMRANSALFSKKKNLDKSSAPPRNQICNNMDLRLLFESQLGNALHLNLEAERAVVSSVEASLNPYNILTANNAFSRVSVRAQQSQRTLENYFDICEDEKENFCGPFPMPGQTYLINPTYFTSEVLDTAPLPNIVSNALAGHRERVDDLDKQFDDLRIKIDDAERDGDNDERARLQERLEQVNQENSRNQAELRMISRKMTEMETTSDHASFLSQSAVEKRLAQRNDFRKLFETNTIELADIDSRHIKGTEAYYSDIKQFRAKALRQVWNTFCTSDNITDACKYARSWYEGLAPGDRWFENNQFVSNLSPYGNMIARIYSEFGGAFILESNFALTMLMLFTMLASYRYDWDLRPNMLITGEGAVGKSFIFDIMEMIATPGLLANVSHATAKAFASDQDMSDVFQVHHEMDTFQLGIDHNGHEVHADSLLKNRLTKQCIVTISPRKNADKRETETSICRCMGGMAGALNEKIPSTQKPIMTRFFPYQVRKRKRMDVEEGELCFMPPYMEDDHLRQLVAGRFQLQMFYLFVVEKAIEAGAMPDVDLGVARMVSKWVFAEMQKRGVGFPQKRHLTMYEKLARVATIYYAIEMEFFSEHGIPNREYPSGQPRDFDPAEHLEKLIKWFFVTQEISVHVLTLMESVWVPNLRAEVAEAVGRLVHHSVDSNACWQAKFDGEKQTQFRVLKKLSPGAGKLDVEFETDYNYVSITGLNMTSISELIRDTMTEKPSADDIASVLSQMQHEYIHAAPKMFDGDSLADDNSVAVESIQAALVDNDPHENGRRLSVAVDVIKASYKGTLKGCVEAALQHAKQMPATFITGFSYAEEKVDDRGKKMTNTFYNIADVVECKPNNKLKAITNNFSLNLFDVFALSGRVNAKYKVDMSPIKRTSAVVLDKNLDLVHFTANCVRNGIRPESSRVAYPPATQKAIWDIREADSRFKQEIPGLNGLRLCDMVMTDYPKSFADKITEKMKNSVDTKQTIDDMVVTDFDWEPTKDNPKMASYMDMIDVAGKNEGVPRQIAHDFIQREVENDMMIIDAYNTRPILGLPNRDVTFRGAEYDVGILGT